jgi:hypothetical protein
VHGVDPTMVGEAPVVWRWSGRHRRHGGGQGGTSVDPTAVEAVRRQGR